MQTFLPLEGKTMLEILSIHLLENYPLGHKVSSNLDEKC